MGATSSTSRLWVATLLFLWACDSGGTGKTSSGGTTGGGGGAGGLAGTTGAGGGGAGGMSGGGGAGGMSGGGGAGGMSGGGGRGGAAGGAGNGGSSGAGGAVGGSAGGAGNGGSSGAGGAVGGSAGGGTGGAAPISFNPPTCGKPLASFAGALCGPSGAPCRKLIDEAVDPTSAFRNRSPAIATDAQGRPHVLFYIAYGGYRGYYTVRGSGGWATAELLPTPVATASLVVGADGFPVALVSSGAIPGTSLWKRDGSGWRQLDGADIAGVRGLRHRQPGGDAGRLLSRRAVGEELRLHRSPMTQDTASGTDTGT